MINPIIIKIVCLVPVLGFFIILFSNFYLRYVLENNKLDDRFLDHSNTFITERTIGNYLKDETIPLKAKKDLRRCRLLQYLGFGSILFFIPFLLIILAIFSK